MKFNRHHGDIIIMNFSHDSNLLCVQINGIMNSSQIKECALKSQVCFYMFTVFCVLMDFSR